MVSKLALIALVSTAAGLSLAQQSSQSTSSSPSPSSSSSSSQATSLTIEYYPGIPNTLDAEQVSAFSHASQLATSINQTAAFAQPSVSTTTDIRDNVISAVTACASGFLGVQQQGCCPGVVLSGTCYRTSTGSLASYQTYSGSYLSKNDKDGALVLGAPNLNTQMAYLVMSSLALFALGGAVFL